MCKWLRRTAVCWKLPCWTKWIGKPMGQVTVTAYKQNSQASANADSNGMARLRLPPGDYQITASRASMSASQTSASVPSRPGPRLKSPRRKKSPASSANRTASRRRGWRCKWWASLALGWLRTKTDAAGKF